MPFRFVHTADIHLDSPLRSLALLDPQLAEAVGAATRRAFERIVDLCLDENADALMIAGDLYDGDQTSMKTALFLAEQLRRLHDAGVRAFIVRGNHDAESKITAQLRRERMLPDSATVFDGRGGHAAVERPPGAIPVAVHGVSFSDPRHTESPLPKFRPPVAGAFNIGLLHTSLGGAKNHDPYAPCGAADLFATGFDYWCLGHIHQRIERRDGNRFVVMPGIPQGRRFREDGPKSVTVVDVADDGTVRPRERAVSVAQFQRLRVDLSEAAEWGEAFARVGAALAAERAAVEADTLIVRLTLTGETPLNWLLRRDPELAREQARIRAGANTWIDKVELDTAEPGARAARGPGVGRLDELERTMRGIAESDSFAAWAAREIDDLTGALPREAQNAFGSDAERRAAILRGLAADGRRAALARLREAAQPENAD